MAKRERIFERFVIHTIMPAPGWQAVYWGEEGHYTMPIPVLALVDRREYRGPMWTRLRNWHEDEDEEFREVVGMEYTMSDGWTICDEMSTYCGLIPPDATLEEFEAVAGCRHAPPAKEEPRQGVGVPERTGGG